MTPVALVHGWAGSFEATWERSGFTALLEEAGRPVIGIDLLGHGTAPKPHDPPAYADLTIRVVQALPDGPVDAVGYSLGAFTLLRATLRAPGRFGRLVLAGIGKNVFHRDTVPTERILAGLEHMIGGGDLGDLDPQVRLFVHYAQQPGNDLVALTAVMKQRTVDGITRDQLAAITCPVLIVVGSDDFVHPADELVDALPDARAVTLRNVDHFATPEASGFFDAALEFLDAV